jgi:hypothetical protein
MGVWRVYPPASNPAALPIGRHRQTPIPNEGGPAMKLSHFVEHATVIEMLASANAEVQLRALETLRRQGIRWGELCPLIRDLMGRTAAPAEPGHENIAAIGGAILTPEQPPKPKTKARVSAHLPKLEPGKVPPLEVRLAMRARREVAKAARAAGTADQTKAGDSQVISQHLIVVDARRLSGADDRNGHH